MNNQPQQIHEYTPGIWESIRGLFNSATRVSTKLASTIERGANVLDVTINSGEIMAQSTNRIVRYSTMGKEAETIRNLVSRYPELDSLIAEESKKQ